MSTLNVNDIKAALAAARWSHGAEIVGERAAGILALEIHGLLPPALRETEVAAILEAYTDEGLRTWLNAWLNANPLQRRQMEVGAAVEWSGEWAEDAVVARALFASDNPGNDAILAAWDAGALSLTDNVRSLYMRYAAVAREARTGGTSRA